MSKLKHIIIVIGCFFSSLSYAAGPITHVALGEIWLRNEAPQYTEDQKKLFLLGTVFPDIRYLGVIKREETHEKGVTLQKIRQVSSPFEQGMLFHSYVDDFREKWVKKSNVEKKLPDYTYHQKYTFLKLVEDQIIYNEQSWGFFRQCLMSIPIEEKEYGIDDKSLGEWHTGLTLYFTVSPTILLTQFSMLEKDVFTIKSSMIKDWATLLPQYVQNEDMKKQVADMMAAFEKAIQAA